MIRSRNKEGREVGETMENERMNLYPGGTLGHVGLGVHDDTPLNGVQNDAF